MRTKGKFALLFALSILAVCAAPSAAKGQAARTPRTKEVKLYFPKDGESPDLSRNPFNLQPVKRTVNAAAPVRGAVEALLKGPTGEEERQGFHALDAQGLYVTKLTLRGGTAHASFRRRGRPVWAGDLAPDTFRQSVERTLRQFPEVRRTIVCVDGLLNFGGLGDNVPDKKCPK